MDDLHLALCVDPNDLTTSVDQRPAAVSWVGGCGVLDDWDFRGALGPGSGINPAYIARHEAGIVYRTQSVAYGWKADS